MVTSLWGPIAPTAEAEPASLTASEELSIPGLTDPPWRVWHTETVRSQADVTRPDSFDWEDSSDRGVVEIGPDGQPRLLFTRNPPGEVANIVYAWPEDGEWRFDRVEHKAVGGDLALDSEGDPWITWLKDGETYVATRNGTDDEWWRMKIAEPGIDPRIEVGPRDRVHVAFADSVDGVDPVRHGLFDPDEPDQGWTFSTADHGFHRHMDLAVDGEGRPHLVWTPGLGPSRYAVQTTDGWQAVNVPACTDENAIAIGPSDRPHVACHARGGPWGVVHAVRQSDGSWNSEVASDGSQLVPPRSPRGVGYGLDLAVDDDGRAHVTFRTGFNPFFSDDPTQPARPVYAVNANGPCPNVLDEAGLDSADRPQNPCTDWHVQAVDRDGAVGALSTSVALDGEGVPVVSYDFAWRTEQRDCHQVVNPCYDLRLATPWVGELGVAS